MSFRRIGSRAIVLSGLTALVLMAFGAGVALAADYQDANRNVCEGNKPFEETTGCPQWGTHVTGFNNVALGEEMMPELNSGDDNVALNFDALTHNTTGSANVAIGVVALDENTTGSENVASGYQAMFKNTGSSNVALGAGAGISLTTGSNNIDISNDGIAAEEGTTRIGTDKIQTKAFVAGIFPTEVSGCFVQVTKEGQLGCNPKGEAKEGKEGPPGKEGKEGKPGPEGKEGKEGKPGASGASNAAVATFASNQNVVSGQCLNYNAEDEPAGSCPNKATGFPISGLLTGPIPANGAKVTNLYAETNAMVSGKDTVLVEAIDNTSGVALLSCTVNSTTKNHCSNTGSSVPVATGDKIEVRVTASGSSGNNKQWQVTFRY